MTRQEQSSGALVVTVSASYGAGGSIVAPALAERLGRALLRSPAPWSGDPDTEHILERLSEEERAAAARHGGEQSRPHELVVRVLHQAAADLDSRPRVRGEVRSTSPASISRPEGGVILGRSTAAVLGKRARRSTSVSTAPPIDDSPRGWRSRESPRTSPAPTKPTPTGRRRRSPSGCSVEIRPTGAVPLDAGLNRVAPTGLRLAHRRRGRCRGGARRRQPTWIPCWRQGWSPVAPRPISRRASHP